MTANELQRCGACGGSSYEGDPHICRSDLVTSCRRCGETCTEPGDPEKACTQCKGSGTMRKTQDNPATPEGLRRLADFALAASPVPDIRGVAYMVDWEAVKSAEDVQLIEDIKAAYQRRNRKERQAYGILVLRAMKKKLMIPSADKLPS